MDRKGMTLVEIMVVVAILVSLSAVLAVNVKEVWDRAKVSETEIRMGMVEDGLHTYAAAKRGVFPTTAEGLDVLYRVHGREEGIRTDAWGNNLVYRSPDGDAVYSLSSPGPDGQEGGGDDIVVALR
jgi:general secretion pathway protein G